MYDIVQAKDPFSQPLSVHCELLDVLFVERAGMGKLHDFPDDLAELLCAGAEHLAKTHLSTSSNRETDFKKQMTKHNRIGETQETPVLEFGMRARCIVSLTCT